jgi:hypothetical protein
MEASQFLCNGYARIKIIKSKPGLWICRIDFMLIRIQLQIQGFDDQKLKKNSRL